MCDESFCLRLIPYLDPHLSLRIVDFLIERKKLPVDELNIIKLRLLQQTDLFEQYFALHATLHPGQDIPENITHKKEDHENKLEQLKSIWEEFTQNDAPKEESNEDKKESEEQQTFDESKYSSIIQYGHLLFAKGNYEESHKILTEISKKLNHDQTMKQVLWGKLCCEILLEKHDESTSTFMKLRNLIESRLNHFPGSPINVERKWLMHWVLFVAFRSQWNPQLVAETLMDENYYPLLLTSAPYLLRYYISSILLSRVKRTMLTVVRMGSKQLNKEKNPTAHSKNPMVLFMAKALFEGNVKSAKQLLNEFSGEYFESDYFLSPLASDILTNGKMLLVEVLLKVKGSTTISRICDELSLQPEEVRQMIVSICKSTKFTKFLVKFDAKTNVVTVDTHPFSIIPGIMENCRDINEKCARINEKLLTSYSSTNWVPKSESKSLQNEVKPSKEKEQKRSENK